MERGLLWLPLLATFAWLAWAGWNEYQKVEAYRRWALPFDRAKYDIYAVLGQKGDHLTWGTPRRQGPINVSTFSLTEVNNIRLLVNQQSVDLEQLPTSGTVCLEFCRNHRQPSITIPFTEIELAAQWAKYLQQRLPKGTDSSLSS